MALGALKIQPCFNIGMASCILVFVTNAYQQLTLELSKHMF